MKLPKKLKISARSTNGSLKHLGTMEQDNNKQLVSGEYSNEIKDMVGNGLLFDQDIYTLKDRELFIPLMIGYTGISVDATEQDDDENDNQD